MKSTGFQCNVCSIETMLTEVLTEALVPTTHYSVLRHCKVLLTEAVKWLSSSSEEVLTEALVPYQAAAPHMERVPSR